MQHHDGRRLLGRRADHAVFEIGGVDAEEAGGGEGGHSLLSLHKLRHSGTRLFARAPE